MVEEIDNSLEAAERALSRSRAEKHRKKEEKESKLPREFILIGALVILVVVVAFQFIFTGEETPQQLPIPPQAQEQFTGQLEMYAGMVENYRNAEGELPQTEREFLRREDPAVTYEVTGADSYRLEYFFLDTTFVLERTLDPILPVSPPDLEGPGGPLPVPSDTP